MVEMAELGKFPQLLAAGRARFNALFAQARRIRPTLDAGAFSEHLRTVVAPIVEEAAAHAPERAAQVLDALYEISLELVGSEILGRRSRYPELVRGWEMLLAGLPAHLSAAPRQFTAAVSNALYNLSIVPGARIASWVESMLQVGKVCPHLGSLLDAGKVAAWRAGLAHFRPSALETCRRLGPEVAPVALGLAPGVSVHNLDALLDALAADPWVDPARQATKGGPKSLQLVATVGGFRGFGGIFRRPPEVVCLEEQFYLRDAEDCWVFAADRFGATFHRTPIPNGSGKRPARQQAFQIDSRGKVTHGGYSQTFPHLAEFQSFAANATTLAVTTPLSHKVFLVALCEASDTPKSGGSR